MKNSTLLANHPFSMAQLLDQRSGRKSGPEYQTNHFNPCEVYLFECFSKLFANPGRSEHGNLALARVLETSDEWPPSRWVGTI